MENASTDLRERISERAHEILRRHIQMPNKSEAIRRLSEDYTGFMGKAVKAMRESDHSLMRRYGNQLKTLSIASNRVSNVIKFMEGKKWNPYTAVDEIPADGERIYIGLKRYELLALFPKIYFDMITRQFLRSDSSISEDEWAGRAERAFGIIDEAILNGVAGSGLEFQRNVQKKQLDSERYRDIPSRAEAYASALDLTEQLVCDVSMSDESEEIMNKFRALFERHSVDPKAPFSINKNGVIVDYALTPRSRYTLTAGNALFCYPEDYLAAMEGSFVAGAQGLLSEYGVELDMEGTIALNSIITNE